MINVESLRKYGADVDKGLSRCANNEALYIRLVKLIVEELRDGALFEALKAADLDRAFDVAHKLKGGVTNLALTPISVPICELTELLRNKKAGDYEALYFEIVNKTDELAAL